MKYLNFFESITKKKYWEIRIDEPYFEVSMHKIGATEEYNKIINDNVIFSVYKKYYDKVYIYYSPYNKFSKFKWTSYSDDSKKKFEDSNYIYQGEINVTQNDIEKYNIIKQTKKFNI